jgi:hypothetical protein
MKYDNFNAVDNGKSKIMKYDNFNAVDNGFANLSGGSPNSLGILPFQQLPNFSDSFAFETPPPQNIGLPATTNISSSGGLTLITIPTNLKLVICMDYMGVQGSNPSSDSQYAKARQQWLDRVRPATLAFMRNAKTIANVNILNSNFAMANSLISVNPLGNYKPFRFRAFLAHMNY